MHRTISLSLHTLIRGLALPTLGLSALCFVYTPSPVVAQDCTGGTWTSIEPINTARSRTGLAFDSVTGHFFLAGGEAQGGNRNIPIEEYDPVAGTWTNRSPLSTGVSNTGAAVVGGYVYVPGGWIGSGSIDLMQRYDPATDTVELMTAMPADNAAHAVAVHGTLIHVLGGGPGGDPGATHFVYDTATDSWTTAAPLPTEVQYPAAASDGSLVYVLGGNTDNLATVQVYDPATDTWAPGPSMITGRGGPGAFFADRLWAVGGGWAQYFTSTEYVDAGIWTGGPPLNVGARTIAVAIGDLLVVKAGGWNGAYLADAEALSCVESGVFEPEALEVDFVPSATSDGNGVFELPEIAEVAPSWSNAGSSPHDITGTASNFTGPAGPDYSLPVDEAIYGLVAPAQVASCRDVGPCYEMGLGPSGAERPALHWDAAFEETLSETSAHTWTLHIGDSFLDVPRTHPFYGSIEKLLHNGVSSEPQLARLDLLVLGCSDAEFCPAAPNTRAEAAVMLVQGVGGGAFDPPPCTPGNAPFDDVPVESPFCPWIRELAARGVTAGCGASNYCPDQSVTRAHMAVFLLKTLLGTQYQPEPCDGVFDDVTCPSMFANWIEDLSTRGFTAGCSETPSLYCPGDIVTRGQMAALVVRTFELDLYGP